MNYFSESSIIQKISSKIIQPKQSNYNEEPILYALSYLDHYEHVDSSVYNKYQEKLKVSLFFNKDQPHENCVLYMHGYGSNRTEGIFLLRHLPKNISLCCFDFSAEGKSQGKIVTFGQKQKDDIKAVLGYLRSCGYKKFVLWGRSMGATCTLLFSIKEKPTDVILQIIDSPFISFTQAALQLTKKRIAIPQAILKITLQALCKNLANKQYNPFEIDLNNPIHCPIPTVFVYSENDEVISPENSLKIINNFRGYFQKIVIKQLHNVLRKNETIRDLVNIIKKKLIKNMHESSCVKSQIRNKLEKKNSLECYGIWVSSKMIPTEEKTERSYAGSNSQPQISSERRLKSSIKVYSSLKKGDLSFEQDIVRKQQPRIHRLSSPKIKKEARKPNIYSHYL